MMLNKLIVLGLLSLSALPATSQTQMSVNVVLPHLSIGVNLPIYPHLVLVPGYPVYYAPRLNSNYFFYDGMYWVYQDDSWYASYWYNGPWDMVGRDVVPLYVLRIPVRYYRSPPAYFIGWQLNSPPRWDEHWGNQWSQQRRGWNNWNRRSAPSAAPLPTYQRKYSGDNYPRAEQQQSLQNRNYRYQPRDPAVRQQRQESSNPAVQQRAVQERNQTASPAAERSQNERATVRQTAPVAQPQTPANDQSVQRAQQRRDTEQLQQQQQQRKQEQKQQQVEPRIQLNPAQPASPRQEAVPQGNQAAREQKNEQSRNQGRGNEQRRAQKADEKDKDNKGQDKQR